MLTRQYQCKKVIPSYPHEIYNGFEIETGGWHRVTKDGELIWELFLTIEAARKTVDASNAMKMRQQQGLRTARPEIIEDENGFEDAERFAEQVNDYFENKMMEDGE